MNKYFRVDDKTVFPYRRGDEWYDYRKEAYVPHDEIKKQQAIIDQQKEHIARLERDVTALLQRLERLEEELRQAEAHPTEGYRCPECDEVKSVKDFENNDFICKECRSNR